MSLQHFKEMSNALERELEANKDHRDALTDQLITARKAGDDALVENLIAQKKRLIRARFIIWNDMERLIKLRQAWRNTVLEPSEAEDELANGVAEIEQHLEHLDTVAAVLNTIANVASVLTRLLGVFS